MCTWEQFCRLAREPERRKVGVDARVTIAGTAYEVDPQLAGETVLLLGGLFDDALYVEYEGERSGPYLRWPGRFPCIDTERSSAANARSAPTVSVTRPISSPCPWPPWRRRPPAATADRPTDQPAATPHAALRCGRPGIPLPHDGRSEACHCSGVGPAAEQALTGRPGLHRPRLGGHADASPRPRADPCLLSRQTVRSRPCGLTSCSIMASRSR